MFVILGGEEIFVCIYLFGYFGVKSRNKVKKMAVVVDGVIVKGD